MAYPLYEELQVKDPQTIQYYPEEYDYPAHYSKVSNVKHNHEPIEYVKKYKKVSPSVNYVNEKKCSIYVHQYNKSPVSSTYNNYSSLKTINKNSTDKNLPLKTKRNHPHPNKSVLDQLEETYWATWKPNKENNISNVRNRANEDRFNNNKAYGDTSETLVKYFATADFNMSAMSVLENNNNKYRQKLDLINFPHVHDIDKDNSKLVTTNTQQIQTEGYPLILPKIDEQIESTFNKSQTDHKKSNTEFSVIKPVNENPDSKSADREEIEKEKSDTEDESNLLKHTDSLIINKKKQGEVKEHFQQPRCIKLYKKPGTSTSFVKGGSYPLKSCLKREPVIQKGNFKLGAPGSPILVTTSSYNKKSRK